MDALLGYASSSESDEQSGDVTLAPAAGECEGGEITSDSDDSQEEAHHDQQQDCNHSGGVGRGQSDANASIQEKQLDFLSVSVPPLLLKDDKKAGTYPTFVYAAIHVPEEYKDALAGAITAFQKCFPDLQAVEPVRPPNSHSSLHKHDLPEDEISDNGAASRAPRVLLRDQYHVSLSRPATVRYSQIDGLIMSLREFLAEALSSVASSRSGDGHEIGSSRSTELLLEMSGWDVFANDDRSKSFIASGIPIGCGRSSVIRAIRAVDRAFLLLDLPLYYSSPMPHVSLGWLPGDRAEELRKAAEDLSRQGKGDDDAEQGAADGVASCLRWRTTVDEVCCMIGERVYTVWPWPQEHHQLRKKPKR